MASKKKSNSHKILRFCSVNANKKFIFVCRNGDIKFRHKYNVSYGKNASSFSFKVQEPI